MPNTLYYMPSMTLVEDPTTSEEAIAQTDESRLVQWVELPAGRYRLSYYARDPDMGGATGSDPTKIISVVRSFPAYDEGTGLWSTDEEPLALQGSAAMVPIVGPIETRSDSDWGRYYSFFDVSEPSLVGVAIVADLPMSGVAHRTVDIAALMLENVTLEVTGDLTDDSPVSGTTNAEYFGPRPFFNTNQTLARTLPVCEDTTGYAFRRDAWRRHCVGLCPDGYGDCPGALEQHCYYETALTLDPEDLQRAGLLGGAGFAFGNFNYRVEDIGLNIVGTGIRDCSGSGGSTPSTCYASGNVSYSIVHQGPYPVRNHRGSLYDAPLFTGRIERARAPLGGALRDEPDVDRRSEPSRALSAS